MATQTVEFIAVTGQTVTAKLFSAGSDTVVAFVSATEATNRKGIYTAAFTDVAAGTYRLIALTGSTPLAAWWVDLTLTTATFQAYEGSSAQTVASVTGNVGGNVTGSIGSLAAQAKADVNAEVVDALSTDTYAELSSPPAATSSLKDKLTYVFQWLRNKSTQTSSQRKLYADDGTTVVATETTSDDGTTYTKGEAA